MNLFLDFFRQNVPKNSGKTFLYYRQSVRLNDQILAIYFFVSFMLVSAAAKRLFWPPVLFQAALLLKYYRSEHISAVSTCSLCWCCWSSSACMRRRS